jgi:ATP-dependent DNA helicase RecQ
VTTVAPEGAVDAPVESIARERLGITALRPEQQLALRSAIAGRDTLVVMPTGSGKSAVYQLAGEVRRGPSLVVSPLLALQHDQVRSIEEHDLSAAAALNSSLTKRTFDVVLDDYGAGRLEFLFVSPEQLANPDVRARIAGAAPSLFVVDEAHCISMWGHDFRPDYLALADAIDALGRPPVLALTASAAPPVRDEIVARLRMRDPAIVVGSFDRPELDLSVRRFTDAGSKLDALLDDAASWDGAAIVYVATRAAAESVAEALTACGLESAAYHGALDRAERARVHEAFFTGDVRVVAATNAFGMGIDKPDVRVVAHLDVPGSIDAYAQEIGRAGRDGDPASAHLYFRPEDLGLQRFFTGADVDEDALAATLRACAPTARGLDRIARDASLSRGKGRAALERLADVRAVRHTRRGWERTTDDLDAAVTAAADTGRARTRLEQSRIDMMRTYAETSACRRVVLLGYYGEEYVPPCGRCDNCRTGDTRVRADAPFRVGDHVRHTEWGPGTVMISAPDRVVVLFDEHGYRTLATDLVVDGGLLTADAHRP